MDTMEVCSGIAIERNESYLDLDFEFELNSNFQKVTETFRKKMKIYEGRV